jgi:hypothetical protein
MNVKWPWLVLMLTACTDPDAPNGKEGILLFRPDYENPVAEGLVANLTLPSKTPRLHLDFTNTTLAVEARAGVSVVETKLVPQNDGSR